MDSEKAKAVVDTFRASMQKPKGEVEQDPGKVLASCERQDGTELRVTLKEYQGRPWIDVRIWQAAEGEKTIPTKKGVGIRTRELPDVVEALVSAMQELQKTA